MVVELLEYVGSRLKELNPYIDAYAVNALRLSSGKVAKLSGKKDFEYVGISDLHNAGFYIRLNGKPRYSPRKARTSNGSDYEMFVPVRLVFYSTDTKFEGSRIENKIANDLIKFNFKDYKGNAGSPKFIIVQTSYDAISVFEEETGIKFQSSERPVIVSIDANLRLIMAENACNDFCDVYEILCGQTSPPVPNPDTPPMQTFCEAVANCESVRNLDQRVTTLEEAGAGQLNCENLGDCAIIQGMQENISTNQQAIIDEISARENADAAISNDILAEAGVRASADAAITANLNAHANSTNNPHDVTLEQARAENNQIAGNIDANGAQIDNLVNPTQNQQASTKGYTDAAEANAKAYADSLLVGVYRAAGDFDASTGLYPSSGTGTPGNFVRKGDTFKNLNFGNIAGYDYDAGDSIYAIIDNPGQNPANWGDFEHNTQQATEGMRGTAAIATQAEAEDENSTNDEDIVTPKKLWQAFAHAWTLTAFLSAVRGTLLTGISFANGAAVIATDSILIAIGKLQKQITDLTASKQDVPVWVDYSSTTVLTGWSSTTNLYVAYCKVGHIVFVRYFIAGASDSAKASFTVPFAHSSSGFGSPSVCRVVNSGIVQQYHGRAVIGQGSTTVNLYRDETQPAWTALGTTKQVQGELFYQVD